MGEYRESTPDKNNVVNITVTSDDGQRVSTAVERFTPEEMDFLMNIIKKKRNRQEFKFNIEDHSTSDKKFGFSNKYIFMQVDYDDVNHIEVDTAVDVMKKILDDHWDENMFRDRLKFNVMKKWNENRNGLQSDFESIEEYLEGYDLEIK